MVHKSQLQTFHIGDNLLSRVKLRSVKFPSDSDLIAKIEDQKEWNKYRENIMEDIPKARWPNRPDEVDPMIFGTVKTAY